MDVDPVMLKLIVTTTTLNDKINSTILDDGISQGHTLTIIDLSQSNALENCVYVSGSTNSHRQAVASHVHTFMW